MMPGALAGGLRIQSIAVSADRVVLEAAGSTVAGRYLICGRSSMAVHDRYRRRPHDLPWRGHQVRLVVTVRRFRCRNLGCARRTFTEDLGDTRPARAQRTASATDLLIRFAHTTGGEAGSRLARASGVPIGPDTLLRLLRTTAAPELPAPRVLGIDNLCLRRSRTYATIFVDLETHHSIDLCLGRDAAVVAEWLREHPGVEIVARDGAEAYAKSVRVGAPKALHVADRFYFVQNASAALDDLLQSCRRRVEIIAATATLPATSPTVDPTPLSPWKQRQVSWHALYEGNEVIEHPIDQFGAGRGERLPMTYEQQCAGMRSVEPERHPASLRVIAPPSLSQRGTSRGRRVNDRTDGRPGCLFGATLRTRSDDAHRPRGGTGPRSNRAGVRSRRLRPVAGHGGTMWRWRTARVRLTWGCDRRSSNVGETSLA
jgi:hypothetical protein